jgi:hypothetical protein
MRQDLMNDGIPFHSFLHMIPLAYRSCVIEKNYCWDSFPRFAGVGFKIEYAIRKASL